MAGCWHCNSGWAKHVIGMAPGLLSGEERKVVLHTGDFGFWRGMLGHSYLTTVSHALTKADAELYFVDGNHEQHDDLRALRTDVQHGPVPIRSRIFWLPRGSRWRWHDHDWLALGGAVSVDRGQRTKGLSWWPEEEISEAEAEAAAAAGTAAVMVCHDCPSSVPLKLPRPPKIWRPSDLKLAGLHREHLQTVVDVVQPKLLVHGHYHLEHDTTVDTSWGGMRVTGLDCDGGPGDNVRVLDTRTLAWTYPKGIAA
jgi:hypothetical protein